MAEADAVLMALLGAVTSPAALVAGRNLFSGPPLEPDAGNPSRAVYVIPTGGLANSRFCGSAADYQVITCQVLVRSDRSDYASGLELARACLRACHAPTTPSGYVDLEVREPEPFYARRAPEGRHTWTFNVVLVRVRPA